MAIASQFPFLIGLLASATLCGAWWYAALRKRKVAIFYWLAAAHTLSFGTHVLTVGAIITKANIGRIAAFSSMQTLMSVVMAALYVALVIWLVDRPDQP